MAQLKIEEETPISRLKDPLIDFEENKEAAKDLRHALSMLKGNSDDYPDTHAIHPISEVLKEMLATLNFQSENNR